MRTKNKANIRRFFIKILNNSTQFSISAAASPSCLEVKDKSTAAVMAAWFKMKSVGKSIFINMSSSFFIGKIAWIIEKINIVHARMVR